MTFSSLAYYFPLYDQRRPGGTFHSLVSEVRVHNPYKSEKLFVSLHQIHVTWLRIFWPNSKSFQDG